MYKMNITNKTKICINKSTSGELIEQKIARILTNSEPIQDGAPLIYTDRKDGVQPSYDIRTDRFDVAVDAMDKVTKAKYAKRDEYYKPKADDANNVDGTPIKIGGE